MPNGRQEEKDKMNWCIIVCVLKLIKIVHY